MSYLVVLAVAAPVAVLCVLGARLTSRTHRIASARRAVDRRERTEIGALREGELTKIQGVVAAREPLLRSPISGRPCVGYAVIVDDSRGGYGPDAVSSMEGVRREDWRPFTVTDETGTAVVSGPFSMLLEPHDCGDDPPASAYGLLAENEVRMKDLWGPRKFWFRETLLKAGDRVSVVGRPSRVNDPAGRGPSRAPTGAYVMRGSLDEPVVVSDDRDPDRP